MSRPLQAPLVCTRMSETRMDFFFSGLAYIWLVAPTLWTHNNNGIIKLEHVQRLARRFISSKYRRLDYPTVLHTRANLPLLVVRCPNQWLKLLYMIRNDFVLINSSKYIQRKISCIAHNKDSQVLQEYRCSKDCFFSSFFPTNCQRVELPTRRNSLV